MFIRELQSLYPEPKPHFNTLSTQARTLEKDGFLGHKAYGNSYCYLPSVTKDEYKQGSLSNLVKAFFGDSYRNVVSSLVKDDKLSLDDLKDIIRTIESGEV